MIEDPQPPAYTAVSLTPESTVNDDDTPKIDESAVLTTTSLRRINRLLFATAGWTANFRGLACALALNIAAGFVGAFTTAFLPLPRPLVLLVVYLATVQLFTAWTHIIITVPSPLRFYRRLPTFTRTFKATWLPTVAYWLATQVTGWLPRLLARAFGLAGKWDPTRPNTMPALTPHALWQGLLMLVVMVTCAVVLVIPAQVALVRVQASLLPADADTIVPFDRSFGGAVEPEVVTGKGYVDFRTAWLTFSRESWIRLLKLLGKIAAVTMAAYFVFLAIVVPEFLLMLRVADSSRSA